MAFSISSGVGLDSMRGKSLYDISGKIVISPEYFWLRTETALVRALGKMPISAMVRIRCRASSLARWVALFSQDGPDGVEADDCCAC